MTVYIPLCTDVDPGKIGIKSFFSKRYVLTEKKLLDSTVFVHVPSVFLRFSVTVNYCLIFRSFVRAVPSHHKLPSFMIMVALVLQGSFDCRGLWHQEARGAYVLELVTMHTMCSSSFP